MALAVVLAVYRLRGRRRPQRPGVRRAAGRPTTRRRTRPARPRDERRRHPAGRPVPALAALVGLLLARRADLRAARARRGRRLARRGGRRRCSQVVGVHGSARVPASSTSIPALDAGELRIPLQLQATDGHRDRSPSWSPSSAGRCRPSPAGTCATTTATASSPPPSRSSPAAMLLVVQSADLVLTLVGWEVMGWCSYLLIGHWSRKESARRAALKAFLVTRLADVGFVLGVVILAAGAGSTAYPQVLQAWAGTGLRGRRPVRGAERHPAHRRHGAARHRHPRQVRHGPVPRLAARRDGGPDPRVGPHPRGDHGRGRHLRARPAVRRPRGRRRRALAARA